MQFGHNHETGEAGPTGEPESTRHGADAAVIAVEHTFQYQRYPFDRYMSSGMEKPLWPPHKLRLYSDGKVSFNACRRHGSWQWTSEDRLLIVFHYCAVELQKKRMDFCRVPETNTFVAVGVNDATKMAVMVWMPPEIEGIQEDFQVL